MSLSHSKTPSRICRQSRESGIALISVLWALLLLSALAGAAAYVARANSILTHRQGEIAQAEAAADAALVNAISKLSDEQPTRHPAIDGESYEWEFQDISSTISISNEAGRIDLNAADDDLILAFLYSQGLNEDQGKTLLGDLRARQHVTGGTMPRSTLRSIEELRRIPSWRAQPIDCWMNSLTVYTGQPGVSPSDATADIKEALKWAQGHHLGGRDWTSMAAAAPSALADRSVLGEVLRIDTKVSLAPNIGVSGEWVGRLTGDRHQPTMTLSWSRANLARPSQCKKS